MDIGKHEVLQTLQRFDLMGTGCGVNDMMRDEYAPEAERIARLVGDGKPFEDAITSTFDDHFWAGCLQEAERRENLEKVLADLSQQAGQQ